jgi:hypothetical protein
MHVFSGRVDPQQMLALRRRALGHGRELILEFVCVRQTYTTTSGGAWGKACDGHVIRKAKSCLCINILYEMAVDMYGVYHDHEPHIRPSGVRPLNYPERVQKAWGFFYGTDICEFGASLCSLMVAFSSGG